MHRNGGWIVRVGSRYAEWNPAQERWTADAGQHRFATVLPREHALRVEEWFGQRGVEAEHAPDDHFDRAPYRQEDLNVRTADQRRAFLLPDCLCCGAEPASPDAIPYCSTRCAIAAEHY